MSDFYRILRGLEINGQISLIAGEGPPGISGDSISAKIGSAYSDILTGTWYTKITTCFVVTEV